MSVRISWPSTNIVFSGEKFLEKAKLVDTKMVGGTTFLVRRKYSLEWQNVGRKRNKCRIIFRSIVMIGSWRQRLDRGAGVEEDRRAGSLGLQRDDFH